MTYRVRISNLRCLALTSVFSLLCVSCVANKSNFNDNLEERLLVRLDADSEQEVFLSDLTGGYYYDHAYRGIGRGEFGYSVWDRHYVSGWQVMDTFGDPLDTSGDNCEVLPYRIVREYQSGLRETIEPAFRQTGMLVKIERRKGRGMIVKPLTDMRRHWEYASSEYDMSMVETTGNMNVITIKRVDDPHQQLAVVVEGDGVFMETNETLRLDFPLGKSVGRVSESDCIAPLEYHVKGKGPVLMAFGVDSSQADAIRVAKSIISNRKSWRKERKKWTEGILEAVEFQSDSLLPMQSFDWARLTLASMIIKRDDSKYLMDAVPYSPYPSGWYTPIAAQGVAVLYNDPHPARELMGTILKHQQSDLHDKNYGMLPIKFDFDSARYRIPAIAGLYANTEYSLRKKYPNQNNPDFEDELALTAFYENKNPFSGGNWYHKPIAEARAHFLMDSPAAPERIGLTAESQVLINKAYGYWRSHKRIEKLIPGALKFKMNYTQSFMSIEVLDNISFFKRWMHFEDLGDSVRDGRRTEHKRVTYAEGKYMHNLWEIDNCPDYLSSENADTLRMTIIMHPDTTERAAQILAKWWENPYGERSSIKIFNRMMRNKLEARTGLRSLSPHMIAYQPKHRYYMDAAAHGSTSFGDILPWTAGVLGDLYLTVGKVASFNILIGNLQKSMMSQGVVGALPFAETSEPIEGEDPTVWSPVHSTAIAEYVRLFTERYLGLDHPARRKYIFKPTMPDEWGRYRVSFPVDGGTIWMERPSPLEWHVGQDNIPPSVSITVDVSYTFGQPAMQTAKVFPGESMQILFRRRADGIIKGDVYAGNALKKPVTLWGEPNQGD